MTTSPKPEQPILARAAYATLNYGLGRIFPKVAGLLLIPLYAVYLTPADYGILELAAVSGDVLVIMMRLGVPGAVSRFYFDHREGEELSDYLTTVSVFQVGCSLAVSALAMLAWPLYSDSLMNGLPVVPFGALVVINSALLGASDMQRRLMQAREQSGYSSKLSMVMALVHMLLAIFFVVVLKQGVYGMLWATLIGTSLGFAQATYYLWPNLRGHFRKPLLKDSLKYASGIFPNHLMAQVAPFANRTLLVHLQSLASLGILSMASKFVSPVSILTQAFSAAYLPIYFSLRKEDTPSAHARIVSLTRVAWSFMVLVTLALVLFVPLGLELMLPESFHASGDLIPFVALASLAEFIYVLVSPEIFYAKKSWMPVFVSITTAITSLTTTALLVEKWGATGVAIGMTMGLVASSFVGATITRRLVDLDIPWRELLRTGGLAFAVGLASVATARLDWWPRLGAHLALMAVFAGVLVMFKDPLFGELRKRFGGRVAKAAPAPE